MKIGSSETIKNAVIVSMDVAWADRIIRTADSGHDDIVNGIEKKELFGNQQLCLPA